MKRILTLCSLLALSAVLSLSGCGDAQSFGIGPWPVYTEPPALEFSPAEQVILRRFAADNPTLFNRIQNQSHAWRAIVQEHNKRAKEMNKRQLKALGFDDDALRQTLQ